MVKRSPAAPVLAAPAAATFPPRGWLLFVSQVPTSPSNVRVRMWRRLQQLGAIAVKQAVYALPDTPQAREDFEWLKASVTADGGEATIFAATAVTRDAERALTDEFRRARQASYAALADEIDNVLSRAAGRRRGVRAPALDRLSRTFTERLASIERIDFFGSAGRDRVTALLARLDQRRATPKTSRPPEVGAAAPSDYRNRLWVTRPRPGVDRMSSAWLIRRFVDPGARFGFAMDVAALPEPEAIAFDMFGAEFSHRGDACTFEVLRDVFGISDPAVDRIAALVHDLDLKDGQFDAPDAPTVGAMIGGLQLAIDDDDQLLQQGITLFDSLHRGFTQTDQPPRPRPVASARGSGASGKPRRRATAWRPRPAERARRPKR